MSDIEYRIHFWANLATFMILVGAAFYASLFMYMTGRDD